MRRGSGVRACALAGLLLAFAGIGSGQQTNGLPGSGPPDIPKGFPSNRTDKSEDPFAGKLAEQQARSRNTDRQKKLVSDTDRLLALATELKQQVDKTDKNTLSIDVVKKADEIEKLAHSVKEKMKGGV